MRGKARPRELLVHVKHAERELGREITHVPTPHRRAAHARRLAATIQRLPQNRGHDLRAIRLRPAQQPPLACPLARLHHAHASAHVSDLTRHALTARERHHAHLTQRRGNKPLRLRHAIPHAGRVNALKQSSIQRHVVAVMPLAHLLHVGPVRDRPSR